MVSHCKCSFFHGLLEGLSFAGVYCNPPWSLLEPCLEHLPHVGSSQQTEFLVVRTAEGRALRNGMHIESMVCPIIVESWNN